MVDGGHTNKCYVENVVDMYAYIAHLIIFLLNVAMFYFNVNYHYYGVESENYINPLKRLYILIYTVWLSGSKVIVFFFAQKTV